MGCSYHVSARFDGTLSGSNHVSRRAETSAQAADLQSFRAFAISKAQNLESFVAAGAKRGRDHLAARAETYFEQLKPLFRARGDMV
jgi:hypothetical protein